MPRVFFITGTSSGFGNELVKIVLAAGDIAIATSRSAKDLSFEGATEDNFLSVQLDVTSPESVDAAFEKAVGKFGKVDVVVNNAGYGILGPFETISEKQFREQFEVNFFGLVAVTRKAIEVMRDTKSGGVIQQVTSIGGQVGVVYASAYCASKWAVEGFTETIAQEVKPEWGIKFTCIEPGGFRTEWAGESMEYGNLPSTNYGHLKDVKQHFKERNGNQGGDPTKGAQAMYDLAIHPDPPLRIVLGSDAHGRMVDKGEKAAKTLKEWEKVTLSTDVDA